MNNLNTLVTAFASSMFVLLGLGDTDPAAAPAVADTPLAELFSADGGSGSPAPPETPLAPAAPPQAPAAPEFFLESPTTGTRYRTAEEAIRGTAEKDNAIAQLRQQVINATGQDPFTGQRFAAPQAPQAPANDGTYLNNPQKYYQDLQEAVTKGDQAAYFRTQQKMVDEQAQSRLQETLAPYASFMNGAIKSQAIAQVSSTIPEFAKVYGSPEYKAVLQANPTLANAITAAESNVQFAQQLPGLYQTAHAIAENATLKAQLSAALKAQATTQPSPGAPPRTTLGQSTLTPPIQTTHSTADFRTNEASRKAILEQGRANGLDNMDLSILTRR